ncbi:hypothetical protein BHM03_00004709 [Ensete ventricosum]|uniref:Bulb-type lectin domain-containing protein n=1 Tax=Ensete ventricosum TaxID=4639 RepID=A0A445MAS1_ENSVE|nr:hypothetical protein BHM03_00004709 [Ensete ventricosum]
MAGQSDPYVSHFSAPEVVKSGGVLPQHQNGSCDDDCCKKDNANVRYNLAWPTTAAASQQASPALLAFGAWPTSCSHGGWLRYGRLFLQMPTDCNLVLHDAGRTLWASDTAGNGISCYLSLQHGGNLVLYTSDATTLFGRATSTGNKGTTPSCSRETGTL